MSVKTDSTIISSRSESTIHTDTTGTTASTSTAKLDDDKRLNVDKSEDLWVEFLTRLSNLMASALSKRMSDLAETIAKSQTLALSIQQILLLKEVMSMWYQRINMSDSALQNYEEINKMVNESVDAYKEFGFTHPGQLIESHWDPDRAKSNELFVKTSEKMSRSRASELEVRTYILGRFIWLLCDMRRPNEASRFGTAVLQQLQSDWRRKSSLLVKYHPTVRHALSNHDDYEEYRLLRKRVSNHVLISDIACDIWVFASSLYLVDVARAATGDIGKAVAKGAIKGVRKMGELQGTLYDMAAYALDRFASKIGMFNGDSSVSYFGDDVCKSAADFLEYYDIRGNATRPVKPPVAETPVCSPSAPMQRTHSSADMNLVELDADIKTFGTLSPITKSLSNAIVEIRNDGKALCVHSFISPCICHCGVDCSVVRNHIKLNEKTCKKSGAWVTRALCCFDCLAAVIHHVLEEQIGSWCFAQRPRMAARASMLNGFLYVRQVCMF